MEKENAPKNIFNYQISPEQRRNSFTFSGKKTVFEISNKLSRHSNKIQLMVLDYMLDQNFSFRYKDLSMEQLSNLNENYRSDDNIHQRIFLILATVLRLFK